MALAERSDPRAPGILPLILGAVSGACARAPEAPALTAPRTGTSHVLYGTASEGRHVNPASVRVARAAALTFIQPDPLGGGEIDMFFVGFRAEDLPATLEPERARFLSERDERAHALPDLFSPHVLRRPSLPDHPEALVPVEDASAGDEIQDERRERFETMLDELAIEDPCVEPDEPIAITAPRTPAENISTLRTLSSGETFVGFTASSTTIMGVLPAEGPEGDALTLFRPGPNVRADLIAPRTRTRITDLGDTEARGLGGRMIPNELTVNVADTFVGVGLLAIWSPADGRYVDGSPSDVDTGPFPGAVPARFYAARHLVLRDEPSLCVLGSAHGGGGAIWCRSRSSTDGWRLTGHFPGAMGVAQALQAPGMAPMAFGLTGTIYLYEGEVWTPVLRSTVNDACPPICNSFVVAASNTSDSEIVAVLAGSDAEVLALTGHTREDLAVASVSPVADALFSNERTGSEGAIKFSASVIAPDGTIWLGSDRPVLFRVSADLSRTERICLPNDARDAIVTALAAQPSGRLLIGMTPPLLGFARWR